jgi:hypothetical protein
MTAAVHSFVGNEFIEIDYGGGEVTLSMEEANDLQILALDATYEGRDCDPKRARCRQLKQRSARRRSCCRAADFPERAPAPGKDVVSRMAAVRENSCASGASKRSRAEACRPASARAISASSDDGEISAAALATAQGLFTLQSFTSRLQVWT